MSFETEHAKGECEAYRLAIAAEFDGELGQSPEAEVSSPLKKCGTGFQPVCLPVLGTVYSEYCSPAPAGSRCHTRTGFLHQAVKAHLAECRACEEYRADLLILRDDLVGLPELSMPDDALATVFAQTIDVPTPARVHRWGRAIRIATFASAAAVVLALGLPLRFATQTKPTAAAEVERAAAQTLFVLGLASDAIERAERVTVEDVLDGRISPALKRVSDEWLRISIPTLRRLGT